MNIVPNCPSCGDNVDMDRNDDGDWFCHNCNHNKYPVCEWCGRYFYKGEEPSNSRFYIYIVCSV
ncbi:hypothetical protein M3610_20605 [Neobacillus sp. MER 74]|uniref:hypothetical protein n=1 Tax=Neobacillus sp. MER 74 TaxID=2939566 RepID=UPI0020405C12|nr:hypothetical protein [Neobacillus sp. MER 74]MCM3117676.1 hypothetical protein [Neobacillus sp. MER 74]